MEILLCTEPPTPNPVLPDIEVKQSPNSLKDDVLEYGKEWVRGK